MTFNETAVLAEINKYRAVCGLPSQTVEEVLAGLRREAGEAGDHDAVVSVDLADILTPAREWALGWALEAAAEAAAN